MGALLSLIAWACSVGMLICFILVLVRMFQVGQTGLGIACIVLSLLCGLGGLVAFIAGWMNAVNWRIQNVMQAWAGCLVGLIVARLLFVAFSHGPLLGW